LIFYKYHGLGNDFILLEDFDGEAPKNSDFAVKQCHRRFGIGADGILYISRSKDADASMKVLNSDGSEAEMCGNGIRCVAKHLYDMGIVKKRKMRIDTLAGIKEVDCEVKAGQVTSVTVSMGAPDLECENIPMACQGKFISRTLDIDGRPLVGTAVSMGNPHFVIFERLSENSRQELGPKIEGHPRFPRKTNVEFAEVLADHIDLRVYERGAGWTLACGTGACATVVAAVVNRLAPEGKEIEVRLPGGSLWINVAVGLSSVTMRGPAVRVYRGELQE
jgi:diaminopimelate epimerase